LVLGLWAGLKRILGSVITSEQLFGDRNGWNLTPSSISKRNSHECWQGAGPHLTNNPPLKYSHTIPSQPYILFLPLSLSSPCILFLYPPYILFIFHHPRDIPCTEHGSAACDQADPWHFVIPMSHNVTRDL
jgi:hypothetical protein